MSQNLLLFHKRSLKSSICSMAQIHNDFYDIRFDGPRPPTTGWSRCGSPPSAGPGASVWSAPPASTTAPSPRPGRTWCTATGRWASRRWAHSLYLNFGYLKVSLQVGSWGRLTGEHSSGLEFVTYTAEPVRFLPRLLQQFQGAGGQVGGGGWKIILSCYAGGAEQGRESGTAGRLQRGGELRRTGGQAARGGHVRSAPEGTGLNLIPYPDNNMILALLPTNE